MNDNKQVTMDDMWGDGSDHAACPKCGFCISCGDCERCGCGRENIALTTEDDIEKVAVLSTN